MKNLKILKKKNSVFITLVFLLNINATAQNLNSYVETTTWIDQSPLTEYKIDGLVYIKKSGKFFVLKDILLGRPLNAAIFGVKADGHTDDTVPLQKAVDFGIKAGWSLLLPIGTLVTSKKILVDLSKAETSRKIQIKGAGRNLSIIYNIGSTTDVAFHIKGDMKNINYFNIEGFSIKRKDIGKPDGGTAIRIENLIHVTVKDIDVFRFKIGFEFNDIAAGYFENIDALYCDSGLINKKTPKGFTYPNLLNYVNCSFVANSTRGALIENGHNVKFDSCSFEGNYGSGLEASYNGLNGSVSLNVINCYFENNINDSNIKLTMSNGGAANFIGNTFNRSDNKTQNNIIISVDSDKKVKLNMIGNGFLTSGTFMPSEERPDIKIIGKKQNLEIDDKNYY